MILNCGCGYGAANFDKMWSDAATIVVVAEILKT
jgi:hypothetical protein